MTEFVIRTRVKQTKIDLSNTQVFDYTVSRRKTAKTINQQIVHTKSQSIQLSLSYIGIRT
jgi:hypothetical protein